MNSILDIQNLTIAFPQVEGEKRVVNRLSFSINKGECVALVGESGSGKSLTALSIMQLLPYAAQVSQKSIIQFAGENILNRSERDMRAIRGSEIGMIFQDAMTAFNPVFTIGFQMQEALHCHRRCSKEVGKKIAYQYLEEVGIQDPVRVYFSYAHQLSGGMRQRAMIAMALCCEPKLIIADEPTTALDVTLQAQILQLLKSLQAKHNTSLLFISHDLAIVSQLADDILVLQNGECVEHQSSKDFYRNPQHNYSKKLLAAIPPLESQMQSQEYSAVLSTKDLAVYFTEKRQFPYLKKPNIVKAVDGVDLTLLAGETLALVGESGSGKTTVAKALVRLYHPTHGEIQFDQRDIANISLSNMHKLRRDIQMIFQDPYSALNPRMMIADSLTEGIVAQHLIKDRQQQLAMVDELLKQVKLDPEMKWRYPHEFSGGERQRLCIARALALDPKVLILDEPTSALDVSIQKQVLDLLKEIQQQKNIAFLLITHNLSVVAYMAHRIAVMYQGKIIEHGTTESVLKNPQHEYTARLLSAVPQIAT